MFRTHQSRKINVQTLAQLNNYIVYYRNIAALIQLKIVMSKQHTYHSTCITL